MTQQAEVLRLKRLIDEDLATPADKQKYRELIGTGSVSGTNGATPPAQDAPLAPVAPSSGRPYREFNVDEDRFKQGWSGNSPPKGEGWMPGLLVDIAPPQQEQNTGSRERARIIAVLQFKNVPGTEEFFGSLFISERAEGKLKDSLDELGIRYNLDRGRLQIMDDPRNRECDVHWQFVEIRGSGRELRIQEVRRRSEHAL